MLKKSVEGGGVYYLKQETSNSILMLKFYMLQKSGLGTIPS